MVAGEEARRNVLFLFFFSRCSLHSWQPSLSVVQPSLSLGAGCVRSLGSGREQANRRRGGTGGTFFWQFFSPFYPPPPLRALNFEPHAQQKQTSPGGYIPTKTTCLQRAHTVGIGSTPFLPLNRSPRSPNLEIVQRTFCEPSARKIQQAV